MGDSYQYPVYFECRTLLVEKNRKKTESYFRVHRRSGGGDCGPLTTVADNVYSIAFKNQKDQQEVLKRSKHEVELTDGRVVFSVRGNLPPPSSSHDTTAAEPAENQQSIPEITAPLSGKELLVVEEQPDEHKLPALRDSPDAEELLSSGFYSAEHHQKEEETLARRLSQTDSVGEVSYWKGEEDQQCGGTPDHSHKDLHEVAAQHYKDEVSRARTAVVAGTLVKTETLDIEDKPCLGESLGTLHLAEKTATYNLTDDLQLMVYQGDITRFGADALVNSSNEDLNHCEGIAAALTQAGGPDVQFEIDSLRKRKGQIPTGEVVVTIGGNLPCKRLLHAVGPVAGKEAGEERVLLERTVRRALSLAELMKFKSIAMPCIGSGVFGIPVTVCSDAIVCAVKEFCSQGGKSLKTISLIDDRGEVVRAMQEACDRHLLGQSAAHPTEHKDSLEREFESDGENAATAGAPKGLVQVEIVQGTIESQQTDAVVSPMVFNDPLSTRVGNILSKAIGRHVTQRVTQKSEGEMGPGDFILEENLTGVPFGAVFFLNLVQWDAEDDGTAVQVLRLGINQILTSCESKGLGSVALPALGAGIALSFPVTLVARVLLEEISKFEQERTTSTPVQVLLVLPDQEAVEVFKSVQEDIKYNRCTENDLERDRHQDSSPTRIVLLGKTGAGKSHLANTILGEEVFTLYHSPNSGTHTCQSETRTVSGRRLTLIDTPGFFDTDKSEEERKPEIMRCLTECAPGPHVFLILVRVDRFTKQEQQVITKICDNFSEDALKYAVIVFTHGEQLQEGMKIEEFVSQNEDLSNLVKKCEGRCHVFDNKHWNGDGQDDYRNNQVQLEAFLQTVDKMMVEKNGSYYTNDVLRHVEERIQKQEQQIRDLAVYLPPQEIRKQAKTFVSNEFLIQLAGTATGALLGAFFGVAAFLEVVMKVVKNPTEVMKRVKTLTTMAPAVAAAGSEVAVVATGVVAGVATVTAAVAGGARGGVIGQEACKEAKTPMEAIEKSFEAVMKQRSTFRMLPQN